MCGSLGSERERPSVNSFVDSTVAGKAKIWLLQTGIRDAISGEISQNRATLTSSVNR